MSGLCGTGSHDFVVTDAFVPAERSYVVWGEPCLDIPLLRIPEPSLATLSIGAVAVGIAHGALGEVTDLATLLHADAETAWATAVAGTPFTPDHRARIRATATWVTTTAASVVDMAYTAGGGTSLYSRSPLQRRLRDIHALTQHFGVKLDTFTKAGAVLAGQEVDLTFL